jgi:homoserine dehydrogenase
VTDRPGVLADLTAALRDSGVSVESLVQPPPGIDGTALVVMVTHECAEPDARAAVAAMGRLETVAGEPLLMPILPVED